MKKQAELSEYEKTIARCYSTWGKVYYDEYYGKGAPYPPVHTELVRHLLKTHRVNGAPIRTLLDAGCGPASFLRDVTQEGFELYGFDLTPEMVDEAQRVFAEKGLKKDRIWHGSVLKSESFVQPETGFAKFDAAVCAGVLPHISETDEDQVIVNLGQSVQPGGLVILEARNQFFSLFTMNRYTYQFFMDELLRADELAQKAGPARDQLMQALEGMKKYFEMTQPPVRKGKQDEPGYDEVLSRTHNPLVMRQKFEKMGFTDVKVQFYHYHSLPPMFGGQIKEFFLNQSVAMENPEDWRGYFMASAFFVTGIRK